MVGGGTWWYVVVRGDTGSYLVVLCSETKSLDFKKM